MSIKSKCAIGVAAVSLAASFAVSSPASAADFECTRDQKSTRVIVEESDIFEISDDSDCNDLNASHAKRLTDNVLAWYQDSDGVWHRGTAGFVEVTNEDAGWVVLLTNVVHGTPVRGQGFDYNQRVFYYT